MAQRNSPFLWPGFGGLMLAGNPAKRPLGTASVCDNYREMPGGWIRLRSGRTALAAPVDVPTGSTMGEVIEFMQFRANSSHGSSKHIIRSMSGGNPTYWEVDVTSWTCTPLTEYAVSFATSARNTLGWASLDDALVFGNSFGSRYSGIYPASSALRSVPWLTRWDPTNGLRFFGLFYHQNSVSDLVYIIALGRTVPSSGLSMTIDGTGLNYNNISISSVVDLYSGLYNTRSGHYSNGAAVSIGLSTTGAQTIHISGISNVQAPYHSTAEMNEIKIVFYATVPGGKVPYLIMNSSLDGPFTVDYGTSSTVDLSITSVATEGWVLDFTKRMPVNNYPPRQMRDLCYSGGRLFGIPFQWSAATVGYEYEILQSDMSGVCWSYSYGDQRLIEFAGNPLESWDPRNFSPVPSGERPLRLAQAPDGVSVIVLTASQTYLLTEQGDGLMEWVSLSTEHGINPNSLRSLASTRRGVCWVTQRNQVAMIGFDLNIRIISANYDTLIRREDILCGGFVFDPANQVERYEIGWLNEQPIDPVLNWSNTLPAHTLCHDFVTGSAYTTYDNNVPFTAIGQLADADGKIFNLAAGVDTLGRAEIYKREGDPDQDYRIPTIDQDVTGRNPMVVTEREIPDAQWASNWFSPDPSRRNGIVHFDVIGDVAISDQLGQRPVSIETFRDFNQFVADGGDLCQPEDIEQSTKVANNNLARFKTVEQHGIHWKLRIKHQSHATDEGDYHPTADTDGSNERNFYGAILDLQIATDEGVNRK